MRHLALLTSPARSLAAVALLVVSGTAFSACSDDHDHDHDDYTEATYERLAGEFCAHVQDANPVELTADFTSNPPEANEAHTRYHVTLASLDAGDGTYAGQLNFVTSRDLDLYIGLSKDVTLRIFEADGEEVRPEWTRGTTDACDKLEQQYIFDLDFGTHTIEFDATQLTDVDMVFEFLDIDDHDDHDH